MQKIPMKKIPTQKPEKHSAPRPGYLVLLWLEGGRQPVFMYEDRDAANGCFFKYFAFMKTRKRLRVEGHLHLLINRCELHQIYDASKFSIKNLSADTLMRSSDKPFTSFELNDSYFPPTLH